MRKPIYTNRIAQGLIFAFLLNSLGPIPVKGAEFQLPAPGTMVHLSPKFNPPILKGIKVHPENPFKFEFILDQGDANQGTCSPGTTKRVPKQAAKQESAECESTPGKQPNALELKTESTKLIKYFLASLTIPEKDLWVNLSPYEKNRIIPNSFGLTEMGRDLLAEDYMLKQITASLIYPEDEVGKKFWRRIYAEAQKKFGTTNIPVNTFNKVWIIPEKAIVYENAKAGTAYVVESKLKVMLEQDYLAMQKGTDSNSAVRPILGQELVSVPNNAVNALGSQIIREIVIPELTKEINENQNFSQLRQVYNSLILATWYKKKIKDSILAQVYEDKNKVKGIQYNKSLIHNAYPGTDNNFAVRPILGQKLVSVPKHIANQESTESESIPGKSPNDVEQIYQHYLQAFKKGAYNYIKEEQDPITQHLIPRKYFSGGLTLKMDAAMTVTNKDVVMAYQHLASAQEIDVDMQEAGADDLIERLKNILPQDFPSEPQNDPTKKDSTAVLILRKIGDDWQVLMTKRAEKLEYGGTWALPGGKKEPEDRNLIDGGFRESKEEVGLLPHQHDFVGTLSHTDTIEGKYRIFPMVTFMELDEEIKFNRNEVIDEEWVSLRAVSSGQFTIKRSGEEMTVEITGVAKRILEELNLKVNSIKSSQDYLESRLNKIFDDKSIDLEKRLSGFYQVFGYILSPSDAKGINGDLIKDLGQWFRRKWQEKGFEGYANQYLAMFGLGGFIGPMYVEEYIQRYKKLIQISPEENILEDLLGKWQAVSIMMHLHYFGPHAESAEGPYRFFDNEYLAENVKGFIGHLIQWKDRPELNGYPSPEDEYTDPVKSTYRDLMLWGLVLMLDPLVHDYMLQPTENDVVHAFSTRLIGLRSWPGGAQDAMSYYLKEMLTGIEVEDGQGGKRKISDNEIEDLLIEAFSTDWKSKGLRVPTDVFAFSKSFDSSYTNVYGDEILPPVTQPFLKDRMFTLAVKRDHHTDPSIQEEYFRPALLHPYAAGLTSFMFLTQLPFMQKHFPRLVKVIHSLDSNGNALANMHILQAQSQTELKQFKSDLKAVVVPGSEIEIGKNTQQPENNKAMTAVNVTSQLVSEMPEGRLKEETWAFINQQLKGVLKDTEILMMHLLVETKRQNILVAFQAENDVVKPVGFYAFFNDLTKPSYVQGNGLYVASSYQRKGVGRYLMEGLLTELKREGHKFFEIKRFEKNDSIQGLMRNLIDSQSQAIHTVAYDSEGKVESVEFDLEKYDLAMTSPKHVGSSDAWNEVRNTNNQSVYSIGPFVLWPLYDIRDIYHSSKITSDRQAAISFKVRRLRSDAKKEFNLRQPLIVPPISAVIGSPVNAYSLTTILGMLHEKDQIQGSAFFDLGAGSGLLSLVALSMGASKAFLFERSPGLAYMARLFLKAHGYQEGKDFEIYKDIEEAEAIIAEISSKYSGRVRIVGAGNIGPWGFYNSANETAFNIFVKSSMSLFINGGFQASHAHSAIVSRYLERIAKSGYRYIRFQENDAIAFVISKANKAMVAQDLQSNLFSDMEQGTIKEEARQFINQGLRDSGKSDRYLESFWAGVQHGNKGILIASTKEDNRRKFIGYHIYSRTFSSNPKVSATKSDGLYVTPAYRKQGIGQYLIEKMMTSLGKQGFRTFDIPTEVKESEGLQLMTKDTFIKSHLLPNASDYHPVPSYEGGPVTFDLRRYQPFSRNPYVAQLQKDLINVLHVYANVHRGAGRRSRAITALYERAHQEAIKEALKFFGINESESKEYEAVFNNARQTQQLVAWFKQRGKSYYINTSENLTLNFGIEVVVAKKEDFPPYALNPGGGTVKAGLGFAPAEGHDLQEAGTPNIVGVILMGRALQMLRETGNPNIFRGNRDEMTKEDIRNLLSDKDEFEGLEREDLLRAIQRTFLTRDGGIYLDHGASNITFDLVGRAMSDVLSKTMDPYVKRELSEIVERNFMSFINAPSQEFDIILTTNTTDGSNILASIVKNNIRRMKASGRRIAILGSRLEHNSSRLPYSFSRDSIAQEDQDLRDVEYIDLDVDEKGMFKLDELEDILRKHNSPGSREAFIPFMKVTAASNVLGSLNNIQEVARIAKQYGVEVAFDGAQSLAHQKIDMQKLGADYMVFSFHKAYAPGAGALVMRRIKNRNAIPRWDGLNYDQLKTFQEMGRKNIMGIAAIGKVLNIFNRIGMDVMIADEQRVAGYFIKEAKSLKGIRIIGETEDLNIREGVVTIALDDYPTDVAAEFLTQDIDLSSREGVFCALNAVIAGLGLDVSVFEGLEKMLGSKDIGRIHPRLLRISFGMNNTEEDVDHLIASLKRLLKLKPNDLERNLARRSMQSPPSGTLTDEWAGRYATVFGVSPDTIRQWDKVKRLSDFLIEKDNGETQQYVGGIVRQVFGADQAQLSFSGVKTWLKTQLKSQLKKWSRRAMWGAVAYGMSVNAIPNFLGRPGEIKLMTNKFDSSKPSMVVIQGGDEDNYNNTIAGIKKEFGSTDNVFMYVYDEYEGFDSEVLGLIVEEAKLKEKLGPSYDKGFIWVPYSYGVDILRAAALIDPDLFRGKLIQIAPVSGGVQDADGQNETVVREFERMTLQFKLAETAPALTPLGSVQRWIYSPQNVSKFNELYPDYVSLIPLVDKYSMANSTDSTKKRMYQDGRGPRYVVIEGPHENFTNVPGVLDKIKKILGVDKAQLIENNGGIDFTANKTPLEIKNSGEGIQFKIDPAQLAQLQNAAGFVPVIINIHPLNDLRQFMGIQV